MRAAPENRMSELRSLGVIDAGDDSPAHHFFHMFIGVILPPSIGIDALPACLRHQRMFGASMFEVVFVHIGIHRDFARKQLLVVL